MKQKFILLMLALCSLSVFADDKPEYKTHKVNERMYLITQIWAGSYNNVNAGIVIGDDGVLLINSLMASHAPALKALVATLTDKPIKYVINSDKDNYNHHANRYFADLGATIYSHENFKYVESYHQVLFSEKLTLPVGEETVVAYHTPAHTLDHVIIHLPKSNVIFMSDSHKYHWLAPFGPNGLKGYVTAMDKGLSLADDRTIILSGNTSKTPEKYYSDKVELLWAKNLHVDFTNRVGELVKQGLSAEFIAKDSKLNEIASQVENYPMFKQYLQGHIATLIDSEFTKPFPLTREQKLDLVGQYSDGENGVVEVVLKDERLYARQEGKFLFELTPLSAQKFDFKANSLSNHLLFERDDKGVVTGLTAVIEEKSWYRHVLPSGKWNRVK